MRIILIALTIFMSVTTAGSQPAHHHFDKQGDFYVYWGWNRAWYSKSDIHFTGAGYDFTLKKVMAYDRPSALDAKVYAVPNKFTIPQYNFRIGYYIKKNVSVTLGTDHMKYVMRNDQVVNMDGRIGSDYPEFEGVYNNEPVKLTQEFLIYEHTDGLNYANSEIRHHYSIYYSPKFEINSIEGAGAGILYPRSNVTLMNFERNDEFHLAGYGFDLVGGFNFTFFKHFFLQTEFKGGYINMPDVRTTSSKSDKASQHFFFTQINGVFGVSYPLGKKVSSTDSTTP